MQHIAIYLTDTDQSQLRQRFPNYAVMIEALLAPHLNAQFHHFDVVNGAFPANPIDFDAVVVTGSAASVNDSAPWIAELFAHIRLLDSAGSKLIGVCFGHQAIAVALGGRVEKRDVTLGVAQLQVTSTRGWMQPERQNLRLFAGNFDQVVALPAGARVLGGSKNCPIGLMEKGSHVLGVQFHPELSAAYMAGYIENVRAKLPANTFEAAMAEIKGAQDGACYGQWMAHFLRD